VAAVVIVVASNATALLSGQRPAAQPAGEAAGLVEAGGGAPDATVGSIAQLDRSIGAWTANLAANDRDFISATNLGLLYDARGRLTGDVADYGRAQEALARALAIVPDHLPARLLQARLLQTTHDFSGALAASKAILRDDPTQAQALATMGDALLELGQVDEAEAAFGRLAVETPGAAVTARQSRVAYLRGDTTRARALSMQAFEEASSAGETGPTLAWYAYLAGTVALTTGEPENASRWFDKATAAWPGSYQAIAGSARAQAGLDRLDDAIAGYEHAAAVAPQPDALAVLGDLYALRGDSAGAAREYGTVELIGRLAALNRQVYNRQLVLFSVDHGRDLPEALASAEDELAVRKDVFGYDAYGWALLANGRAGDADAAMHRALALGTRDAGMLYHAGVVAAAVGDGERARGLLTEALAIRGALDPLSAGRAKAALEALR
jgi:tetratricopeptide (TPR) repeat protein